MAKPLTMMKMFLCQAIVCVYVFVCVRTSCGLATQGEKEKSGGVVRHHFLALCHV
jgi:hypothetical protein